MPMATGSRTIRTLQPRTRDDDDDDDNDDGDDGDDGETDMMDLFRFDSFRKEGNLVLVLVQTFELHFVEVKLNGCSLFELFCRTLLKYEHISVVLLLRASNKKEIIVMQLLLLQYSILPCLLRKYYVVGDKDDVGFNCRCFRFANGRRVRARGRGRAPNRIEHTGCPCLSDNRVRKSVV
jgi:hypothetical protein